MFFHFARVKSLAFALIASPMVPCAYAQGDGNEATASQPVVFSTPQSEVSPNAPSVTPQKTPQMDTSMPQAPPLFNQPTKFPMPQPQQRARPQNSQQNPNDWTLMTAAEILGVESSDKFLKSQQQQDYEKEREGKTPLERFLKRQSEAQMGISNRPASPNPAFGWDFSRMADRQNFSDGRDDLKFQNDRKNVANFLRNSLDEWTVNPQKMNDNDLSASSRLPSSPASAQQAALARFEELLKPAAKAETAPKSAEKTFSAIQPLVDPNLQPQSQINPVGASYKPLESGIVRPSGIAPLPTLTGSAVAPPVATPSWAPKPAPWLSQAPQPLAIPQRKF